MNTGAISPGCIIHWKEFEFSDGEKADKFLVILGCNTGSNYLAVLGTSKRHKRDFAPGCNSGKGYYHIPGGQKDFFKVDTWLILADPIEIDPATFLQKAMVEKSLTIAGQLRPEMANAIRNCLKQCADVSAYHISLL